MKVPGGAVPLLISLLYKWNCLLRRVHAQAKVKENSLKGIEVDKFLQKEFLDNQNICTDY